MISEHVLDEVNSLRDSVQNTRTQLKEISQELRHVERERDAYRKGLEALLGILRRQGDVSALLLQVKQTKGDHLDAEVPFISLTTTYSETTAASTDPSPTSTVPPTPVTTQNFDLHASTDPSPSNTVPPASVTTQNSDLHASTDPRQGTNQSKTVPLVPVTTQDPDLPTTPSQADSDLFSACTDGDLGTVKRIVEAGQADINTRGGWRRRTAVMEAARWGHRRVVEFLVAEGADASLLDKYRRNILHYACWSGDVGTVKLILKLKVMDINSRGWRSKTPVMSAAGEGKGDVVELLVRRGADVSLVDVDGSNILLYACMGGDMNAVKLILALNVVDINAKNDYGHTAAYMALREGHQQVLDLLESRGAHF